MTTSSRILVVDDQESNVDMLSRRLQRVGYDVVSALNGQEALKALQSEPIDLILLDQMMPGMTGIEVLHAVRATKELQQIPVIMVTAVNDGAAIAEALDAGANDYIAKPLEFQTTLARIRSHLARGRAHGRLKRSEERYALASRGSGEGLWDWNLLSNQVYCDPTLHALLGYQASETPYDPATWFSRVHPSDLPSLQESLNGSISERQSPRVRYGESDVEEDLQFTFRMRHENGSYRWISMQGVTVYNEAGMPIRRVGSIADITRRMTVDDITGLGNQRSLLDKVQSASAQAKDRNTSSFLIIVGIDRFYELTLSLPQSSIREAQRDCGDRIKQAVDRFTQNSRATFTDEVFIARTHDGTYGVLLKNSSKDAVIELSGKVMGSLTYTFRSPVCELFISSSAAIVEIRDEDRDALDIIRDANTALHEAESGTVGKASFFDVSMQEVLDRRVRMRSDLRRAIDRQEFEVFYEPRVRLGDGQICGFEALIRWNHPERGLVSPAEFIPLAEAEGLIHKIGIWVLRTACAQAQHWLSSIPLDEEFEISVNLAASQCHEPDLLWQVKAILKETGLPAGRLKLELTESLFLSDLKQAKEVLEALRDLGVALKIDDFGTGYSSLKYLCDLPFESIKIDRSFVMDLDKSSNGASKVVKSIIGMAAALGMDTVAEGIERPDQITLLQQLGCNYGQGYLFFRPMNATAAAEVLKSGSIAIAHP